MNRYLIAVVLGVVLCIAGISEAANYDNVYWVGGSGEWTGDATAPIPYSTGHWSTDPNAVSGLPAKVVLGRNDGIRVGQVVGSGTYDHDRVACDTGNNPCTGTLSGGTQLGTDLFISGAVTVNYNPNRQILPDDPRTPTANTDRFGDWRIQPSSTVLGTPTLNLSNGAVFDHTTSVGGDADGMWTRWNGAELNLDGNGTIFRRTGDEANGFSGGAMMFASFHGFAGSVQTISISNGARFENEGQLWYGQSEDHFQDLGNQPGIRVVTTINGGHMDLTGGDEYELNNDGLPLRADLAFLYQHSGANKEVYVINFTGPGTITVDGDHVAPLDGVMTLGGGGIRVATMLDSGVVDPGGTGGHLGHTFSNYGTDGTTQRSYLDLWNMGILTAQPAADLAAGLPARSGLTGHTFSDYFTTTNNPGDTDYKLTSLLAAPAANGRSKGDYNNDGNVDAADYVIYRATLGSTTDLRADGDGSLQISAADLVHWRKNFGATGLPTFGSGLGSGVPEPGTALFVVLGLASLWLFKRR